jgi:hypothetical protein
VNDTDGGLGLINSASVESDQYNGSLVSVVEAVVAEIKQPNSFSARFWAQIDEVTGQ